MNTEIIKSLAEKHERDPQHLEDAFDNFRSVQVIKDLAEEIEESIKIKTEKYSGLYDVELIINNPHGEMICIVQHRETCIKSMAIAYVTAKDIHESQMNRMNHQSKNEYDIYLEYLSSIDSDFDDANAFLNEKIGFDEEPEIIKISVEETLVNNFEV